MTWLIEGRNFLRAQLQLTDFPWNEILDPLLYLMISIHHKPVAYQKFLRIIVLKNSSQHRYIDIRNTMESYSRTYLSSSGLCDLRFF